MAGVGDDATIAAGEGRLGPGSVLAARYVLGQVIGEGGMGSVYEALDRELGESVALKLLPARARPEALERFRREVRLARRVTHRNAARTFDIGEHGELHFLTMELVRGESLAALLQREAPLEPTRVAELGAQICEGLAAVHEVEIIHRDLKPANVLVEPSGRVVLTDFGVARPASEAEAITRDASSLVGTPHYMAPEQVAGETLSARSDLYALGVVLYEACTGRLPFRRDTVLATAVARLSEAPPPITDHAAVPAALAELVMGCLQREPSRRPASARELGERLTELARTAPTRPSGAGAGAGASEQTLPAPASSPATGRPPSSGGTSFASCNVGERGLAVLPLRYRGPQDDAYMAEALTEQLIDLLSMTKGLKVPAAGATEAFADRRDPRAVKEALGVDTVVDGTMQRSGSLLRVSIRLLDADTGYQTWSERFDGELQDVFELQDRIAARVAETLRLQLETHRFAYSASAEATALYMRARVQMRTFSMGGRGPGGAVQLLEECLRLAPRFPPALAAHAMVCGQMWFLWGGHDEARDWEQTCEAAVVAAKEHASALPDTHLAAARLHTQRGRYAEAARALHRALQLAPTHAAAHSYLGILQCEAGRTREGLRHIDLAMELEPSELSPLLTAARHRLLHGQREQYEALMDRLWSQDAETRFPLIITRLRVAGWDRDLEAVRRWTDALALERRDQEPFPLVLGRYVLGEVDEAALLEALERVSPRGGSPRYRSLMEQLTVEVMLARGEEIRGLRRLEALAEGILVDVDWIENCPLLVSLRGRPEVQRARSKVRERAQAIWSAA